MANPIINLSIIDELDTLVPRKAIDHISHLAADLPNLLSHHNVRLKLDELPIYDLTQLPEC